MPAVTVSLVKHSLFSFLCIFTQGIGCFFLGGGGSWGVVTFSVTEILFSSYPSPLVNIFSCSPLFQVIHQNIKSFVIVFLGIHMYKYRNSDWFTKCQIFFTAALKQKGFTYNNNVF